MKHHIPRNFIANLNFSNLIKALACYSMAVSSVFAAGDAAKGQILSRTCNTCHGSTGISTSEDFPHIAGQKQTYLVKVLKKYQSGERTDTSMQAVVGPLSAQEIEDVAAYFANISVLPSYNDQTRLLLLPVVNVSTQQYQVEMALQVDNNFKLNSAKPLN